MKYFILFLLPVFLLSAIDRNPANYAFSKINGETGLSQNGVKAIIQDKDGFIWFGTSNKLNRFDGISMKTFNCKDAVLNRGNNNISALYEDKQQILWIGTESGVFRLDPLKEKFSFFNAKTEKGIAISGWVEDIKSDANGNIWIVSPNQGLFRYHLSSKKLSFYQFNGALPTNICSPECICIEETGRVWVGTNGCGVYLYNKQKDSFEQYLGDKDGKNTLAGKYIFTMCDSGDKLIVGIHEGKLLKFNKRKNTLQDINAQQIQNQIIRYVILLNNELWVGTQNGIYIVDEENNSVVNIKENLMDSKSLSDNVVEKIYEDREGGIWITTLYAGVNYLPPENVRFNRLVPNGSDNSISSKKIGILKEDLDGNIWISSVKKRIDIYNPQKGTFKHIETQLSPLSLFIDKKQVIVGYFKNGMDVISLPDMHITHYTGEQLGLDESSIYAIYKDKFDRLWIGNGWHIFIEDKASHTFKKQMQFGTNFNSDIAEDADGNVWVATKGSGVYCYLVASGVTQHFTHNEEDSTSLSSNSVSNILIDSSDKVWFSTERGGICCYNKDKNNFTTYSIKDGLPDDMAYKILEDKYLNLWFETNHGLVKFNPRTKEVQVFNQNQGLFGNQTLYKAALASSDGLFYFSGMDGLVAFDPSLSKNTYIPPVFITQLTVLNKEVPIAEQGSPLTQSITHTQEIVLPYDQSSIGFDFVALSYALSTSNEYAYKMENVDNEWIYTKNQHISYTKLAPGEYTFRVKASNNDGLWNEEGKSIHIRILPAWWVSNWAGAVYFILIATCIVFCFLWYNKKQQKKQQEKQRLFETEKEKELYVAKVDFFTNIAHEIRTPVTLINGPLESLLEMDIDNPEMRRNLHIMEKNTAELLILINQLLDFKKVDANRFNLSFRRINIARLIQDLYVRFETSATQKGKIVQLCIPEPELLVPLDREAVIKILSNLFSNAISYSAQNIIIELIPDEDQCVIQFSNDGELIPPDQKELIFDPFYQLDRNKNRNSTSGIGLSLARSLAELHNGNLCLDNVDSGMNTFVLELPLKQADCKEEVAPDNFSVEEIETVHTKHSQSLLVVEDNPELLAFMLHKLKNIYEVSGAVNGKEALKTLSEKKIDMIISDVMMPEMDGFELCKLTKTNIEYSHIPVVLLTAKNDLNSKLKGLEVGADAYVEKPFSFNYLLSQIISLLTNRQREKEAFLRKPFLALGQKGMAKADEQFMEQIISLIHANITDENFSVENLAEQMKISRSSLHRKIKALSELAPTDFIRLIRLKRAAEIIQEKKYSISEVCYLVGINSPSYFTKVFHKQFGMTPKEFGKQDTKNNP
ncbi:MAG: Sensor histidine kinase TmoS [Candidatus Ordinivivax streblomastigis]|uniref:histidine kinase n=1 Tax=Candidatus Ordinivivax streblomastigis TaxID=2540710 RepID=A0A5M8NYB3_9BACT|nr:MAG: Sensor histidine kinase TmoS [Candidatus Ordinivivax streblomastigis]